MTTTTILAVAAVCAFGGIVVVLAPSGLAQRRLSTVRQPGVPLDSPWTPDAGPTGWSSRRHVRYAFCALLGFATAQWVDGLAGIGVGIAAGAGAFQWLARLPDSSEERRREALKADLPVAADLLASCLAAGTTVERGLTAVADAMRGPLATELQSTVALLRMGAPPERAWRGMSDDPVLAPFARALLRSMDGGAPVADVVARLADDQRSARRWAAEALARRVGVMTVAPLGLCFLPAFIAIGIVPMVLGMAQVVSPALDL